MENENEAASLDLRYFGYCNRLRCPVFAGLKDAKNKAECEKAGGVWIEKDNKCGAKVQ
jgi:hypothetical protein